MSPDSLRDVVLRGETTGVGTLDESSGQNMQKFRMHHDGDQTLTSVASGRPKTIGSLKTPAADNSGGGPWLLNYGTH